MVTVEFPAARRKRAALFDRIAAEPLAFVDPKLRGTGIAEVLRVPVAQWERHVPRRAWGPVELALVRQHRILPPVRSSWFVEELQNDVISLQRQVAILQLKLKAELGRVLKQLSQHEIDARVLKGLATGELDYPSKGMRQTGDVDVLVRPSDLARTLDVLSEYSSHPMDGAVDFHLLKGATVAREPRVEVDLHVRLSQYSRQDPETLMGHGETLAPGQLALPAELRLLHAAGHLLWTPPGQRRLSGLLDIGVIVDRGFDSETLTTLANELGLAGLAGAGLRIEHAVRERPGQPIDLGNPTELERLAKIRPDRALPFEHLLAISATDGWADRLRYSRQSLFPGGEHVRRRGGWRSYYGKLVPKRAVDRNPAPGEAAKPEA